MTRTGYFIRLSVALAFDVIDFTFGRVPVVGSIGEGVSTAIMVLLWGPAGLAYAWELADVLDQFDAFVPTATLIGLYVGWRRGVLFGDQHDGLNSADKTTSQNDGKNG